eukprot:TRINITY_DN4747_c0_g1_i1.p1 TRINITY_DN4747_c0_g1~~TRINITY_DN4747_c0_g1_i1.p1  ORF type:complete len:170 (-),score=17.63 TRINITY_DN4747_c0_g1_i1:65-574(-)
MNKLINCILIFGIFSVQSKSYNGCGSSGCGNNFIPWNYNPVQYNTAGYPSYSNEFAPRGFGYQPCGPHGCGSSYRSYSRPCAHANCGFTQPPCGSYGTFMQNMMPRGMNPCINDNTGSPGSVEGHQIVGGNGRDCPRGFVWDGYRQRCVRVYGRNDGMYSDFSYTRIVE